MHVKGLSAERADAVCTTIRKNFRDTQAETHTHTHDTKYRSNTVLSAANMLHDGHNSKYVYVQIPVTKQYA